ncbi:MAG: transporter substrate-binding domain-containing protein, partial [Desulfatirhabdiaceae bacterium]
MELCQPVNGWPVLGKSGKSLLRYMWFAVAVLIAAGSPESSGARQTVFVGILAFESLYCIREKTGDSGMIASVLREIAAEEGWNIRMVPGSFEKTMERLESGEIDLAALIPYKRQMNLSFDFNQETILSTWAQIYSSDSLEIQSFLDLAGRSVGLIREDEYARSIRNILAGLNVPCRFVEFNHTNELLLAIQKGWVDTGALDRFQGTLNAKRYGVRQTSIIFSPIELRLVSLKGRNRNLLDAIDYRLRKQKNDPTSTYHRELRKVVGADDNAAVYRKMVMWLGISAGILVMTGTAAVIFRRQVQKKTAELVHSQQVLKTEIVARRSAEERYKSIFENTGTATILVDEDMTISMINENAARLLG